MHHHILVLGMMFGTALPAVAQQSSISGHEKQIIDEIARKWETAYNHKDAAAIAEMCTENMVEVEPNGIVKGRDAMQKRLEENFKSGAHDLSIDVQVAYSAGDIILSAGEWRSSLGERPMHGYWSTVSVRDGTQWKHRQNAYSIDPASMNGKSTSK